MNTPCSLYQFSIVEEQLGFLLQSVMMLCCVLNQGLCQAHSTSTTLLFFLLCMCHGVGEYVHTKQRLKVKPLTASVRFIPVGVDCNSCDNHHMAGMANTAPRPCLFTLTHSHTHTQCLSLLLVMIKSKELKTKISHTHSLILSLSLSTFTLMLIL